MNTRHKKMSALGSQLTSAVSVMLVLVILGLMGMGLEASRRLADDMRSQMGFTVKLLPGADARAAARVGAALDAMAGVGGHEFCSADSILAQESRLMGDDLELLLGQNPYGDEYEVTVLPAYAVSDSITRMVAAISLLEDVDEVATQAHMVDSLNGLLSRLWLLLGAVALALLAISFVLINNTVSVAVYSRRFIIHTMKLVGATGAFIRRPFVLSGAAVGLGAAAGAIAVLCALRAWAVSFDEVAARCLPWQSMALLAAAITLLGLLICCCASAWATNRYLRKNYDEMFN